MERIVCSPRSFAAVWATVESAIVLAALCYGVPALRQQGAGLTGYLWRLGHCLCIPRRKTADEEATAYREQYEAYVKAYAAYYGQPDVRTATQHPARPARSSDTISSRPPTPPPKGEDEAARLARRAERDAIRSARARRRAIKALERERERSKPRADPPSRSPTPPDDSFEELLDLYSSGVTDDSVAKPSRESIAAAQAARETRKGRSGRRR